jgi:hypothetical protein
LPVFQFPFALLPQAGGFHLARNHL